MEYVIGSILALASIGMATAIGMGRERAFYPTIMIPIATYYVLFAIMGSAHDVLIQECLVAAAFCALVIAGYRTNLWLVVVALVGHGLFDVVHHRLIDNPGVPAWWPGFCMAFDVIGGAILALLLLGGRASTDPSKTAEIVASRRSYHLARMEAYQSEMSSAWLAFDDGNFDACFQHLERAHILVQRYALKHTYVHLLMLLVGLRQGDFREALGQVPRMLASLVISRIWVPVGNTGRARVGAMKPMPVPSDLQHLINGRRVVADL